MTTGALRGLRPRVSAGFENADGAGKPRILIGITAKIGAFAERPGFAVPFHVMVGWFFGIKDDL